MIRARLIALRERRMQLVARAQSERDRLAGDLERIEAALRWAELGRAWLMEIGRRPLLIAAVAAALALLRPRRALKLLAGGWSLWRLYRKFGPPVLRMLAALGFDRRRTA